jgi:hypothetical protein
MIYKDLKSLCVALSDAGDHPDPGFLAKLQELTGVYWRAHEEAEKQGYVGVGCITYAEEALHDHQLVSIQTLLVAVSEQDMRLLRALASTAGTTPQELASRYLAGRITVEARQLMGGS